ncbi:MAG: HD domain-containing phosphohydrolase [Cyanobacteriota bacterium]
MIPVLVKELEGLEQLPFDLYNKNGRLIFRSGEVLSAGKVLQLRYIDVFRKTDDEIPVEKKPVEAVPPSIDWETKEETRPTKAILFDSPRIHEINPDSIIDPQLQVSIKTSVHTLIDTMTSKEIPDPVVYNAARDEIVNEVLGSVDKVHHLNQLRVFDDYDYSHAVNVSVLAVMLGYKLGMTGTGLRTLALGSLLHDIGKTRIPKQILHKPGALTPKEYEIVKLHAPLGYKIIKDELGLTEDIARIALEHQEKFDGTGYPKGLSGDSIDSMAHVVSVCDVYDALVSTKVYSNPKPSQDALKIMLNYGSSWFNPSVLYKFTHMTSFKE